MRAALVDALVATSSAPDALARLGLPSSLAALLEQNLRLRELSAAPAHTVYQGVLHQALDYASLPSAAHERAVTTLCFSSPLYGLLRADDRIATYRLGAAARLLGCTTLSSAWAPHLRGTLQSAAGVSGVVVDLRATTHRAFGTLGDDEARTVLISLAPGVAGGNVTLKQVRGRVARQLLLAAAVPQDISELVAYLSEQWRVDLLPPTPTHATTTLLITP